MRKKLGIIKVSISQGRNEFMAQQNTSDLIEAYIKQILEESEIIEIRRAEMASLFHCVPSQINYVINTRYSVESKRGGGGYIRIEKVRMSSCHQFLEHVKRLFGDELTEKDAIAIIQKLYEEEIVTEREGHLLLTTIAKSVLTIAEEDQIRASLMRAILERLSYEDRK